MRTGGWSRECVYFCLTIDVSRNASAQLGSADRQSRRQTFYLASGGRRRATAGRNDGGRGRWDSGTGTGGRGRGDGEQDSERRRRSGGRERGGAGGWVGRRAGSGGVEPAQESGEDDQPRPISLVKVYCSGARQQRMASAPMACLSENYSENSAGSFTLSHAVTLIGQLDVNPGQLGPAGHQCVLEKRSTIWRLKEWVFRPNKTVAVISCRLASLH